MRKVLLNSKICLKMNKKETNNPYAARLPNITTPHYESGGEKDNDEGSKSPRSSS